MSGEILAEGKWLRLVKKGRWEFAQRVVGGRAAILIAVTDAGELILVEQHRPPIGGPVIELPAGLIGDIVGQEDEPAADAALRELEEETGYTAAHVEQVAEGTSSSGLSDERLLMFRATGLRKVGPGGGVDHEDIRVHAIPLADVPAWVAEQQARGCTIDIKIWSALYFAGAAAGP